MTSRQHRSWISAGSPDSGLVLPLAQLRDMLRAAGFTVYDWPNDAHLDAEPPEDHTFYSETGWPGTSPKWWRHAIDIMPKPGAAGARELWLLGARISGDRQAGRIGWLKYINRPPTSDLGKAIHESWQPDYAKSGSGDAGHLHLSSITGVETLSSPYNPFAPLGATSQPAGGQVVLGDDDIIAIADAVAQWATVKGALPAGHIGAGVNLNALSARLAALATDVAELKAQAAPAAVNVQALITALQAPGVLDALASALAARQPKSVSLSGTIS